MCFSAGALLFIYFNHVEILGHCVMIIFSRGGDNMRVTMVYNGSERRLRSAYAHLLLIWPQDKGEAQYNNNNRSQTARPTSPDYTRAVLYYIV